MIFQVRGTTVITNKQIQMAVDVESPEEALSTANRLHGWLRKKGLDIYVESVLEGPEDFPEASPLNRLVPSRSDEEVIRIALEIRMNRVSREDYEAFCHYFKPMIQSAVQFLWKGMTRVTPSDMESDLIHDIAMEFMPRFDSTKGKMRPFIKLNILNRLIKLWHRETYVNGNKAKPRADALREYARLHSYPEERLDQDQKRAFVIGLAHRLVRSDEKMKIKVKREFYRRVLELNLHQECLDSDEQKGALFHCYGVGLTEAKYAERIGVTQPTVHCNKARAEKGVLQYLVKNFAEEL